MEQKYVEPAGYFNAEMLKAAAEYDKVKELERAAAESNKEANKDNK